MFVKYGNRFGVGVCFRIAYDFAGTSFESIHMLGKIMRLNFDWMVLFASFVK